MSRVKEEEEEEEEEGETRSREEEEEEEEEGCHELGDSIGDHAFWNCWLVYEGALGSVRVL